MIIANLIERSFAALSTAYPDIISPDAAATASPDAAGSSPSGFNWSGFVLNVLVWGGLFFTLYHFLFRQPKKEMKKKEELIQSIKVGDNVMTTTGMFGKIVEIWADSYIVEFGLNKGVRMPISKDAIAGIREPQITPEEPESK